MRVGQRRRILYVETNEDGTVGGSHLALRLLVTHLDASRFEPIVLELCADPARRAALGEGARARAEAFGIERNAVAIQDVYRELLPRIHEPEPTGDPRCPSP